MLKQSIVIVDDELELAENLADFLRFEGYEVMYFSDPAEAVAQMDALRADAIILDYEMTGVSGSELLRRFKEMKPDTPILVIASTARSGLREEASERGADGFMVQPYEQDELLQALRTMIRND